MRLLVACEDSGSIKEVLCEKGSDTSVQNARQPSFVDQHLSEGFRQRVEIMTLLEGGNRLVAARANGELQLVKISEDENSAILTEKGEQMDIKAKKLNIESSLEGLFNEAKMIDIHKGSKKRSRPYDGFCSVSVAHPLQNVLLCATKSGMVHVIEVKNDKLIKLASHEVKGPLDFAQVYDLGRNSKTLTFAYGGEENLVKICRLISRFSKLETVWEAKNVKNDRLDLKVPIWPTQLRFFETSSENDARKSQEKCDFEFVTLTRYGQFRIYKTLHGRKPLLSKSLVEKVEFTPQMAMCHSAITTAGNIRAKLSQELSFLASDSKKNIYQFDSNARLLGKIGAGDVTGCATFVSVHENKYVLEGGLDRYVRIFDLKTRKCVTKVYIGSKVNSVIMLDDEPIPYPSDGPEYSKKRSVNKLTEEEDKQDDEEMWGRLQDNDKKRNKPRTAST
ncbi:LAMI_0F08284g1_1 [Lachancea mirantina]|uniref:Ribosome biogenesis protein NSA1 n=1 Tax=Lachancea mirantina TaxID=1230905 RepID=A0A1G4K0C1_9SACH|nr:LAMI_0F08284g1_1 [Lachancea mirantina]